MVYTIHNLKRILLQLKSDSTASVSNIVNNNPVGGAGELAQVLHLPVDSKLPTGQERMLPGQQVRPILLLLLLDLH